MYLINELIYQNISVRVKKSKKVDLNPKTHNASGFTLTILK